MRLNRIKLSKPRLPKRFIISVRRTWFSDMKVRIVSAEILRSEVLKERSVPALALVLSLICVILGCCCLFFQSLDMVATVLLSLLSLSLISLFFYIYRVDERWDRKFLILVVFSCASAVALWILPQYTQNPLGLSAILHKSVFSSLLLLSVSIPSICVSMNYFLGAAPRSQDISRYPLLIIPIVLVIIGYALFIYYVISNGAASLTAAGITTPYQNTNWTEMVYIDGWPVWISHSIEQAGMRNFILGTLLLIGLTCVISLPVGVGTGIYLSEYAHGAFSRIVRFSTHALRAISVFILAVTALTVINYSLGTPLSDLFAGFWYDLLGNKHVAGGSFILSAIFLSLLVIPVISRCTEEGLRSLPVELREGSLALGASHEHTLIRIMLPWSAPNIMTGLLLGCAEVAGAVAVIMFVSSRGDQGINPLGGSASLGYMIWGCDYEIKTFRDAMAPYQWSSAFIILIMALGLSLAGVALQQRFSKRYRGTQ
jgi:ABC-type phosphate transport system permease subunit